MHIEGDAKNGAAHVVAVDAQKYSNLIHGSALYIYASTMKFNKLNLTFVS